MDFRFFEIFSKRRFRLRTGKTYQAPRRENIDKYMTWSCFVCLFVFFLWNEIAVLSIRQGNSDCLKSRGTKIKEHEAGCHSFLVGISIQYLNQADFLIEKSSFQERNSIRKQKLKTLRLRRLRHPRAIKFENTFPKAASSNSILIVKSFKN